MTTDCVWGHNCIFDALPSCVNGSRRVELKQHRVKMTRHRNMLLDFNVKLTMKCSYDRNGLP